MTRPCFAAVYAALLAVLTVFTTSAQEAPFIGVVTENKVEVRAGAGRAYYVVGELNKGDMIHVEKVLFNQTWYQVRVPKGITSYVSKAFVDAEGDGQTGSINADRTEFKATSLRGPGESYKGQGLLTKGDKVTILAEEGTYYKIVSPTDAFVFIPAGVLRTATKDDLEAAGEEPKTSTETDPKQTTQIKPDPVTPVPPVETMPDPVTPEPVKPEPVTPEPVKPDPVTPEVVTPEPVRPEPVTPTAEPTTVNDWPAAPQVEVETPARSEALKALEMRLLPYFSLPASEQPLDKMAGAYQEVAKTPDLPSVDQQIIAVRLRTIERRQEILDTLKRAEEAQKADHARTVVPEPVDEDASPKHFTAVGLLMPSTVYDGNSLPLLYRVVDAAPSGRTLAYVAPSDEINIGAMLNRLVGVVGQTNYNRTLKLQVIEVQKIVLLEAEGAEAVEEEAPAEQPQEQ